jgi:hypothetical protein
MVDVAEIETIVEAASAIVNGIVKVAPAIEQGVVSATPYVQAIVGLIKGSNATQEQLDAAVAEVTALSNQLQQPLPADDGTTTT